MLNQKDVATSESVALRTAVDLYPACHCHFVFDCPNLLRHLTLTTHLIV